MACEFPGAHSPQELWENVLAGRRFFRRAPPERLPPEYFDKDPDAPGKSYCDQMAVLTGWRFDPLAFGIPPVTVQATDLAHWLALDTARRAWRDAGLDLEAMDRTRIGVVLGNSLTGEFSRSHNLRFRWPYVERSLRRALAAESLTANQIQSVLAAARRDYEAPLPEITEDTLAGNMANTMAGRVCNYFDLGAGGFTVDGACSSSLLSVAIACNALANGEMDFALAGGVDVSLDPFEIVGFAKTRALATDDIRPYDRRAGGMLTGEGCGLLVLARDETARARGYPIRAVIRGWGISSDGAGGLTAPGVEGQARALRRAYARAGYPLATVELLEGHGTGTALGDKVELTALRRVLDESPGGGVCRIGSIKANLGHCKAAAGAAGLIKAVMALTRKVLPPTLNCEAPNPAFGPPPSPLRPCLEGRAWSRGQTRRRAAVSAMGFGGANAHVTLEETNPEGETAVDDLAILGSAQTTELIILAAPDLNGLRVQIATLLPLSRRLCRAELTDLSAARLKKPATDRCRLALVVESPWGLEQTLVASAEKLKRGADLAALDDPAHGVFASHPLDQPQAVALFPGQGAQRLNMGAHWLRRFPFVRELYAKAAGAARPGVALADYVFKDLLAGDDAARQQWETDLRATRIAQPAITLASLAALEGLRFFGLEPQIAIGHSLGEISALVAGGYAEAVTGVRLAGLRGDVMSRLASGEPGGMAALGASAGEVEELIRAIDPSLVKSNYNSPRQTVVSGPGKAITRLAQVCEQQRISCRQLAVSHAFHSALVAPAADAFAEAVRQLGPLRPGNAADPHSTGAMVISTVTGRALAVGTNLRDYLARQIREPVRFQDAVLSADETKPSLWLELGPGSVLSGFVRTILGPGAVRCLPTDLPGEDGFDLLNRALAQAWVLGFPVKLERLFAYRFHRTLDPETYAPQFIVNPCERVVKSPAFDQPAAGSKVTPGSAQDISPPGDRESLLAAALDWMAKRTGFPPSAISPEKKLREDLNLDSIKAGELILFLAQRLHRPLAIDPAVIANARITDVVETVLAQRPDPEPGGAPTAALASVPTEPVPGLGPWVRAFSMATVPLPMAEASSLPWPPGACVIVAGTGDLRAATLAARLRREGMTPVVADASALLSRGPAPADLALLILVLPEETGNFLDVDPAEFDHRVEGGATSLFKIFRWAGHGREIVGLRGVVLRPVHRGLEASADLDAGGGFLRSLGLEYPDAHFKWLALPAAWSPDQWAETALAECRGVDARIAFAYTPDGQRLGEAAVPRFPSSAAESESGSVPLGRDDVVLVSGGAKGVTCELALALGLKTHARFVLLGSSPPPDASATPAASEIRRNLHRFEEQGLCCLYLQADLTDLGAVRTAVRTAEAAFGRITALLHGAGVTHFRLFRDKDLEEFLACLRIKARGLYHLLQAVPPGQLKALHVVSSVLGQTGMQGQADYALANAWLTGAVRSLKAAYPGLHCLALGYTAWAGTGLAQRAGVLASLQSRGVTPISIAEGTAAYLSLLAPAQPDGIAIITGRLTPGFESGLYAPQPHPRGRFLAHLLREVPGVEFIAEATLAHETDLYLPEHQFEGTPVFPGVMAIEAMVEAAAACACRSDWPVLRAVRFATPLIVPEDSPVIVRALALADPPQARGWRVRVALRSNHDGFRQNHCEAECWFGETPTIAPPTLDLPHPLPAPLDLDPESLSPVPLFQGRFFRRIESVLRRDMGVESLTQIRVPAGEQYFHGLPEAHLATPSPATRDASWQSGALILPPGCLPQRLEELRFLGQAMPLESIFCRAIVRQQSARTFVVDLATFDAAGRPLENMTGLVLEQTGTGGRPEPPAPPLTLSRLPGDLRALLPQTPHAVALVAHTEINANGTLQELTAADVARAQTQTSAPRRLSALANLVAARRGFVAYTQHAASPGCLPAASDITLEHRAEGKPELYCANRRLGEDYPEADISLADGPDLSLAWLGPPPVGADLEPVTVRDAETWRGLLHLDGYALAQRVMRQTGETFDAAATRVWTVLEAGRKAGDPVRALPQMESARGGPWLSFVSQVNGVRTEFLSTLLAGPVSQAPSGTRPGTIAATVALRLLSVEPQTPPAPVVAAIDGLAPVLADFQADLARLRLTCAADPCEPGLAERHRAFVAAIEAACARLKPLALSTPPAALPGLRRRFQHVVLSFLDGSENFRHTLTKPLGYAGDFRLLDLLAANRCHSRGLAYHFDRSQLEYPASVACRQRIEWIVGELAVRFKDGASPGSRPRPWTILDLGIGAAPVERRLAAQGLSVPLCVHAVDLEPAALDYVRQQLRPPAASIYPWRLDLRDPAALAKIGELAAQSDAVIALGLLEALTDAQAVPLLAAVLGSLPRGAVVYTENFVPAHPTRFILEWFLDFFLAYRSADELRAVALGAGADPGRLALKLDATGSLALLKLST